MSEASAARPIAEDFLPVRPDWLARYREPVLDPDLPIVDPHHHLMDAPGHRYMLPEFLADAGSGHRLIASLFVECRVFYRSYGPQHLRSLGETEFVNGVAALAASGAYGPVRACAGIIGNVDLRFGELAGEALAAHVAVAGGRFRGIRNVAAWHKDGIKATTANPPPGLLRDPAFRRGFAYLAKLGLTFDAWILHTQLGDLIDLARTFPDTTIICDHIGGPAGIGPYAGRLDEVFAAWRQSMRELARCPNVNVKLGGMGMHVMGFGLHAGDRPASSQVLADAWKPYVETCIEAFGPSRAMFESNFPVDKGTCSWVVLWNAFKRLTGGCSAAEKRALFMDTACRVYRLDLAAAGIEA
jgi:predicted TIM-barrel fold metal-dependent hydrolase